MGLNYLNLDDDTRHWMLQEFQLGDYYLSPRLTEAGLERWAILLEESIQNHTDVWLERELLRYNCFRSTEYRINRSGSRSPVRINAPHSAKMLAEGEFNRYYLRGLCLRAQSQGISSLVVYRGKEVANPRPESEEKIGMAIDANELLITLRMHDFVSVDAAFSIPSGPNSGLTARLPLNQEIAAITA